MSPEHLEIVEGLEARHAYDKRHNPPASPLDRKAAQAIRQLCAENEGLRDSACRGWDEDADIAENLDIKRVFRALSQPKEPR